MTAHGFAAGSVDGAVARRALTSFYALLDEAPDLTPPLAAISTVCHMLGECTANTITEAYGLITPVCTALSQGHKYAIAASAGCHLFRAFAGRAFNRYRAISGAKAAILEIGRDYVASAGRCRDVAAAFGSPFIRDGSVILIHSYSRVVMCLLKRAAAEQKRFTVYVTDSRPSNLGSRALRELQLAGIKAYLILDAAVAYAIENIDLVLVGAEGVVEAGGIVNQMGTLNVAIVAKERKKPFYVVAESYKFVRMFPLGQYDLGFDIPVHVLARAEPDATLIGRTERASVSSRPSDSFQQLSQVDTAKSLVEDTGKRCPRDCPPACRTCARRSRKQSSALGADFLGNLPGNARPEVQFLDYTPPEYITLLFTDKGVLTPAAVSDELIKLLA